MMDEQERGLSRTEQGVLRRLAAELAEVAILPEQAATAERWRRLNDLEPVRPMVRVYQLPWREMDVAGELELVCTHPWARDVECHLRRTLYQWRHMRWDMVIEPIFYVPSVWHSTGYGIKTDKREVAHDAQGGITAKHYNCQIADVKDIGKISMPELSVDAAATERFLQRAHEVFDGLLEVKPRGIVAHNYAPWDRLAEWCNPQQVLIDLVLRPDFIHALIERLTTAYLHELDQLEALGLLSIGSGSQGVGQGGLGYTSDLPSPDRAPAPVRLTHQWGGAMAQIFSEVSPDMHAEFALAYEKRILDRFGLNYYGCCEPLDRKVAIVSAHLPKLRKISMSAWVLPERGAEVIDGRFVYSAKPSPACLASDGQWNRQVAEDDLRRILSATGGRRVELIMKDVSTVRFEPQRIWEWTDLAMTLARSYA